MNAPLAPIAPRLGQLVRLLGSPLDGEIVAAARAITRTLKSAGLDLHDLAKHVELEVPVVYAEREPRPRSDAPPTWERLKKAERISWLETALTHATLNDWERDFATDMLARAYQASRPLSPKQIAAVDKILVAAWVARLRS